MMFRKDHEPVPPLTTPDPMAVMFGGIVTAARPILTDLIRQLIPVAVCLALVSAVIGGLLGGLVAVLLT